MPKTTEVENLAAADAARSDKFLEKLAAAQEARNHMGHRITPRPATPPPPPEFPGIVRYVRDVRDAILKTRAESAGTETLKTEVGERLDAELLQSNLRDEAAVASLSGLLTIEALYTRKLKLLTEQFGELPKLESDLRNKLDPAKRAVHSLAERTARYRAHAAVEAKGMHPDVQQDLNHIKSWLGQMTTFSRSDVVDHVSLLVERCAELHAELAEQVAEFGQLDFDTNHDFLRNQERLGLSGAIVDPRGTPRPVRE